MLKKLQKNLLFPKCDLWSLPNRHSWKQNSLSYLSPKEKNRLTGAAENAFLRNVET